MHNKDYSSIFIPKEVSIVLRGERDAYIYDSSKVKTATTARLWANSYKNMTGTDPEVVTYINDGFRLKIISAAGNSSQNGKLSFWTCEITAPDGKLFNVGVNSELICELICSSCFINGRCQEDLKFGTRNNQWGFFSESMPAYKEYIRSQDIRDKMANQNTTKYKPGDIVRTLTESKLYVGEIHQYFDISYTGGGSYYPWNDLGIGNTQINLYKKPKKLHCFASSYKEGEYEIWPDTGMLKKKPKRLLTGAKFDHEVVKREFYENLKKAHDDYISNLVRWRPYLLLEDLMYGDEEELTEDRINLIKSRVSDCIKYLSQSEQIRWSPAISKVTYNLE